MKRFLFSLAIIIAVLMSSCSSEDYKTYVPADSKLVGKVDLKAFFSQTGVDQDKLFKDMAEQYGDEFASIKESGIDATTPFYMRPHLQGVSQSCNYSQRLSRSHESQHCISRQYLRLIFSVA